MIFILEELDYNRVRHSIRKSSEQAKKGENTLETGRKGILKLLKQDRDHLMRLVPSKVLTVTKH